MLTRILFAIPLTIGTLGIAEPSPPFDFAKQKTVRDFVYFEETKLVSDLDFQSKLFVPKGLISLYEKHPREVLELLLKIMDGANPKDSVLAAGYAISLLQGPAVGAVCIDNYKEKTYDTLDNDWETTPRKHWVGKVRGHMQKRFGISK